MSWNVIHKNHNKETVVSAGYLLTVGNTSDCEIFLENIQGPHIESQIFLDEGILFKLDKNKYSSYFCNKSFFFNGEEFHFQYLNQGDEFLKNLPSEEEVIKIFHGNLFKHVLYAIQMNLANRKNIFEENVPLDDVLSAACFFLDDVFWDEKKTPHSEEHRDFFKKTLWCLWAQICEHGILTHPIHDGSVSEIMVNNAQCIYLERRGLISLSHLSFESNDELMTIVERICTSVGRRIDESTPFCDARLKDGSRAHAIIPPLALNGPCLTIRKFPKYEITISELVQKNTLPQYLVPFLKEIVESKKNILISGGTGSGKTTLLNCLSSFIPQNERILTIEDAAELKLQKPHIIRLEGRNSNIENKGTVTIRDLLKNALRMRPDRIVIGECRGAEALDMLQAMNTGHDGSMTTIHANSPVDALRRLETLVMFASSELTSRVIREQICSAIHFVVQLSRLANGQRCISSIEKIISVCEVSQKFITEVIYDLKGS